MNAKRIATWVCAQLELEPALSCFVLRHTHVEIGGANGAILERFRVPPGGDAPANATAIVERMAQAVEEHCEAWDRVQRFKLEATELDGSVLASHQFVERGTLNANDAGGSEPASLAGIVGMLMRHVQGERATNAELTATITGQLVAENRDMRASRAKQDELYTRTRIELEGLIDRRHARQLEAGSAEMDEKRKAEAWSMLESKLLPELFKDKDKPEGNGGGDAARLKAKMAAILAKLPDSVLKDINANISPEERKALEELYPS